MFVEERRCAIDFLESFLGLITSFDAVVTLFCTFRSPIGWT